MATSKDRVFQQARTRIQVECFLKLFRLRKTTEYLEASEKIRALEVRRDEADSLLGEAKSVYIPFLNKRPDLQTKYRLAEKRANEAEKSLSDEIEKTCLRFGLIQWCPPEAHVTIEDAPCFIQPSRPIVLVEPPRDRRIDLNAEADREMRRKLEQDGTAEEPPRRHTMADKEGWLTLKIQTRAPLPELEAALRIILRQNRFDPPKTRNRPDKNALALQTFACYTETPDFYSVSKALHRRLRVVKCEYIRGHVLVYGQKPARLSKQDELSDILSNIGDDQAGKYQSHLSSCSRCNNAKNADQFCKKWAAYVNQDYVPLSEQIRRRPLDRQSREVPKDRSN